eukprot:GHVR01019175.1.p1 GENE.GHVR01019175.1~~GHVR01019175.1.p1  ORF type:complete len:301 (+),score=66.04 GHVR01019175.1:168-1070(+)
MCSQYERIEIKNLLTAGGANLNSKNKAGETPLILSSRGHCVELLRSLIAQGADPFCKTLFDQSTALHAAASVSLLSISVYVGIMSMTESVLMYFLDRGGSVDILDRFGDTPLSKACVSGCVCVCVLLLDNGANINNTNIRGYTPLYHAITRGHLDTSQLLCDRGADIHGIDMLGRTPLHWACECGDISIVMWLVDNEVDVNKPNHKGTPPLVIASRRGHIDVVKFLGGVGADITATGNEGSALIVSCKYGRVCVVQWLLVQGVDVNDTDINGHTALRIARSNQHVDVVRLLEEAGGVSTL